MGVGVAGARRAGFRRACWLVGAGEFGVEWADEAAGEGDQAGVARGMGGDELGGEAGSLREAGEDDAVGGDAGGRALVDEGCDAGRAEVR